MTWKLLVSVLMFPYAIAVLLTAVMTLTNDTATSSGTFTSFISQAARPEEITIDQPTIGASNPISTAISYVKTATGWLGFLAGTVALQGPIWEPWTAPVRFFLILLAAPALLMFTLMLAQALSFAIGGIFGRINP